MTETSFDDTLIHWGVKGMRWGVRKDNKNPGGASNRTNREAKKDAKEFTAAKMYFGEGAGTRRKLIKAKVTSKAKKDPVYKKAFDYHVENTDMGKRAEQARGKRKRTDVTKGTVKTAKGIGHMFQGNTQYASLVAAGIFTGAVALHKSGADRRLLAAGRSGLNVAMNSNAFKLAKDFLKV